MNQEIDDTHLLRANIERTLKSPISDEEYQALQSKMTRKHIDKKELFIKAGSFCTQTYFILKGSCYAYYIDEAGNKNTIQFSLEGYWISDLYSFFSERHGIYNAEAIEPTEVLVLSRENQDAICCERPVFERFFRILIQNAFVAVQYRLIQTYSSGAESRYIDFVKKYPDFVQRIPQYLIASYLGIKPQSLSRIRKELIESEKK
jgi:CRP-like cAMP-binding protein